jgi:hypothetical protein
VALGYASGFQTSWLPLDEWKARDSQRYEPKLATLTYPSLLVVDEIGYLPVTRNGAVLFFQLIGRRYEHASTVLTSNRSLNRLNVGVRNGNKSQPDPRSALWTVASGRRA